MTTPDPTNLFRIHASSKGLSDIEIARVVSVADVVSLVDGQVIQHPHQPVEALWLIASGNLRLAVELPGGEQKTLMYLGRSDHFGLLGIVGQEPDPLVVVAEQRSVCLRIPRDAALKLIDELPIFARNLLSRLGPRLRDTLLGQKRRSRPRMVALIHTSEQPRHLSPILAEQLTYMGEKVGFVCDSDHARDIDTARAASIFDADGDLLRDSDFRKLIGGWKDCDRIFIDCHFRTLGSHLDDLITVCDASYWFCTSDSISSAFDKLKPIVERSPTIRHKVNVVRVLSEDEQVAPPCPGLTQVFHREFQLHWNGCRQVNSPVCTQKAGLDRVLHHLRGVCVGLALGGGAARGMAHLGVLQVLEREGITIDRMSGTSAGALTGIIYAAGYDADFLIERFAHDLKPGLGYRMVPRGDTLYVLLKYRLGGWDPMLRKYLQQWDLEQLTLPFSSVAVDLISAEPVIRHQGDATRCVLESINLPGISRPICADGQALVDGGILNVVPANVLANQGSNLIISSDVSAQISFEFAGNNSQTPTKKMKRPGGIAGLVRSRTVQDRNIRAIGGSAADIVIEPDVSSVQITDFKNAPRIAELGYAATEQALPQIRRVLHEMDPQLFPG